MLENFFIQLVLILLSARFLGELVARAKIPSVIGELLAGILIGPSLLGLVEPSATITILAQIGIVLLLFEIGLETDVVKLAKSGLAASLAALAGVITPFLLGFVLSYSVFELELLPSLFIGSTLTATSIGITLRVLGDLNRKSSHEAHIVLGAALIDDILGIVFLSVLYEFATGGQVEILKGTKVLLFIILFLCLAPILVRCISSLIKRYETTSEIPGLLPTTVISLILLFSAFAHGLGAPELLGGFAAGLALSGKFFLPLPNAFQVDTNFSHRVEKQMRPLVHLFTPIFFVNVGLSLNLRELTWDSSFFWWGSLAFLMAAVLGKLASGFVLLRESFFVRLAVGIAMIPRGEVGLIFAEIGKTNGVLNQETYAVLIVVIALTTIFTPVALRTFYTHFQPTTLKKN